MSPEYPGTDVEEQTRDEHRRQKSSCASPSAKFTLSICSVTFGLVLNVFSSLETHWSRFSLFAFASAELRTRRAKSIACQSLRSLRCGSDTRSAGHGACRLSTSRDRAAGPSVMVVHHSWNPSTSAADSSKMVPFQHLVTLLGAL